MLRVAGRGAEAARHGIAGEPSRGPAA